MASSWASWSGLAKKERTQKSLDQPMGEVPELFEPPVPCRLCACTSELWITNLAKEILNYLFHPSAEEPIAVMRSFCPTGAI